jgi:hypothetical protein
MKKTYNVCVNVGQLYLNKTGIAFEIAIKSLRDYFDFNFGPENAHVNDFGSYDITFDDLDKRTADKLTQKINEMPGYTAKRVTIKD